MTATLVGLALALWAVGPGALVVAVAWRLRRERRRAPAPVERHDRFGRSGLPSCSWSDCKCGLPRRDE